MSAVRNFFAQACPLICLVLAVLLTAIPARAQSVANAARSTRDTLSVWDRFDSFGPADGFASPSPADADLGEQQLLARNQRYRPFSINANYSTTWTSNAFYTPNNPVSDVMMGVSLGAVVLPHLGNNFFFEGAGKIQGYRYFLNPVLDFNSIQASAGLLKVFREFGDLGLYAKYEYAELFSPRGAGELLHEHSIVTGVRKMFQFSRANSLYLSAEASFSLGGDPSYALASEYLFFAAHQIQWSRYVQTSLFYQMQTLAFQDDGRADFRNSLGFTVNFLPLKWLSFYSTTWLGWNASNQSQYNFFVANLGGGLGASINF